MSRVVLLDSSILANLMKIPGRCQDAAEIRLEFESAVKNGDHFIIPVSILVETGSLIARVGDGNIRRRLGEKLYTLCSSDIITVAEQSFTSMDLQSHSTEILDFITAGLSMADWSLIFELRRQRLRHAKTKRAVAVWTLDQALQARCA